MSLSERHIAVRALGTMAEFALLAKNERGKLRIETESMLLDGQDSTSAAGNLRSLVDRHGAEWQVLADTLPKGGWARTIVDQL